jgi:hypothetical protein
VHNAFPGVAAHPTAAGDFRVTWQDDRVQSQTGWNTWYRRTTNGGTSWSADIRLSDLATGAPYKSASGYQFPYGDYHELAVSSDGWNHVIWGAGTSYTGPGGANACIGGCSSRRQCRRSTRGSASGPERHREARCWAPAPRGSSSFW